MREPRFSPPTPGRAFASHESADMLVRDGTKLVDVIPSGTIHAKLGETRLVIETPGRLFKSGDPEAFREMLALTLGFQPGGTPSIYSAPSSTSFLVGDKIDPLAKAT